MCCGNASASACADLRAKARSPGWTTAACSGHPHFSPSLQLGQCGRRVGVEAARWKSGAGDRIVLTHAEYLGGHSVHNKKRTGNLYLNPDVTGVGTFGSPKSVSFRFSEVKSVEVFGEQVATSKLGATVMCGVIGGLAAKGSKNQAGLALCMTCSEVGAARPFTNRPGSR